MSLRAKYTALLTALVLAVLAVTTLLALHAQRESLRAATFAGLAGEAEIAAHGIASFVGKRLREAATVARRLPPELIARGREAELGAYLATARELYPDFANGLFVLDRDGVLLSDSPAHPHLRGQSFAYREYFQRTVREDRGLVGATYRSRRSGRPVLTFTAPVRDGGGRLVAVLGCSIDLLTPETLGNYRTQRHGRTGYLYVVSQERQLVLHPEDDRLLTHVPPGANALLDRALDGFEGVGDTVNSRGIPMLAAFHRLPEIGWVVAVQLPRAEAYAPLAAATWRILLTAVLVLAAVTAAGVIAVRRVSRPLQDLERLATRLGTELSGSDARAPAVPAGTLGSLDAIASDDEIGRLARSFARLAARLEEALASLRRAAEDWERTFDSVHEVMLAVDAGGRVVRMNLAAERRFGLAEEAARGRLAHELAFGPGAPPPAWPDVRALPREGVRFTHELERSRGVLEVAVTPLRGADGPAAIVLCADVTARREAERQLQRVEKLESLALLAGGIAHDFNNLLAAILGNLSVARAGAEPGSELADVLADAEQAAARARDVTVQLLTFSRGGAPIKKRVSLAELVTETASFVLRGSAVACRHALPADLWPVEVDEGQIGRVVHNLVLNAAQAMPGGGTIEVSAENAELPGPGGPRRVVRLRVADHGVGIPHELQARIFEPYFTTRAGGHGLGLAAAHGIVTRHGGTIEVRSEPGHGAEFTVILPAASGPAAPAPQAGSPTWRGDGAVLVMDDEEPVRRAAGRMLERLGFAVTPARDGEEACALHASAVAAGRPFAAVILDLTVPGGIGGKDAAARMRALDPEVKVLASSGYSHDPVMADFRAHGFVGVIPKPYDLAQLAGALRGAVEAS